MKLVKPGKAGLDFAAQYGITLIELMIVVAIVAIIAGIAYPSYQGHVTKTRYADAKVKLLEIMQLQRNFFTDNNTYTDELVAELNLPDAGEDKVATDNGFYLIEAGECGENAGDIPLTDCVRLTATANFNDGTEQLTYNSRNETTGPIGAW